MDTGQGIGTETCGLDDVFSSDDIMITNFVVIYGTIYVLHDVATFYSQFYLWVILIICIQGY